MTEFYEGLFKAYKDYMVLNSSYSPKVVKKSSVEPTSFPTIIFKESDNSEFSSTTNRMEYVDYLTYTVDIYTMLKGSIASTTIMNEQKTLTANFMRNIGFKRISTSTAVTNNAEVDRTVMIFTCKVTNYNNSIY